MSRDLPKSIPSIVLSAAAGALEETEDFIQRKRDALAAYGSAAYRRYADECRARDASGALTAKAQALLEWGVMLQDGLPTARLAHRFFRSAAPHAMCMSVARAEVALTAREGFQGGVLRTELLLTLDRKEGLFRHEDRFDGFLVGGSAVKTPSGVLHAIHPEMLDKLHAAVAEGQNWKHIEHSLEGLVSDFKDR